MDPITLTTLAFGARWLSKKLNKPGLNTAPPPPSAEAMLRTWLDELGLSHYYCDNTGGVFQFLSDGRTYSCTCLFREASGKLLLYVRSRFDFRRGAPSDLVEVVEGKGPKGFPSSWTLHDDNNGEHFRLAHAIDLPGLSSRQLGRTLYEMSRHVADFDALLVKGGFAS